MSGKILASLLLLVCLFGAPFALTNVNACGTLNTAGETYVVTTDPLSSAAVCLTISADNIILDCNGATIDYTGAGAPTDAGVFVDGADGVTIRNCIFTDWKSSANAILAEDAEGLVIRNITASNCDYGLHTTGTASSFSIYYSDIGFNSVGIYTSSDIVESSLIDGCVINGGGIGTTGIGVNAYDGEIRNSVVHGIPKYCIRLGGTDTVYDVHNNTMYDCGQAAAVGYTGGGVILERNVHNSFVWNNTVRDSGGYAYTDNYNFATDNTFHSNIAHDLVTVGIAPVGLYCVNSNGHTSYNNSFWNVDGSGFELNCNGAEVYNNSVRNADQGFYVRGQNVELYENIAFESRDGFVIQFPGATGWISVHDNIAHSNAESGFQLENGGSADQTYPFQDNLAWNNSIGGFNIAPSGAFPVMAGNTARNNTIGVYFDGGTGGNFADCSSYANQIGVAFTGTMGTIFNCEIANNTNTEPLGGTGTGVVFEGSTENEVVNSRIYGNDIGVFINDSELDTVSGCDIFANDREAIWITPFAFSTQIINTDSHDNLGGTPPNGLYLNAGGNYPNLTMRNVRLFGNAGNALSMRDFVPSIGGDPAFVLEDSILYGGMYITDGSSGEISDTYFLATSRGNYFQINPPASPPSGIISRNLGIGIPDSQADLGIGAVTTRYGYIVIPTITLFSVTLPEDDVVLGINFVSLISGVTEDPPLDGPAEAHMSVASCNGLKYYYLDGLPTTHNEIVEDGTEFTPAYFDCSASWVMFRTTHFTGYAAEGLAPEDGGGKPPECITASDCLRCEICRDGFCTLDPGHCNVGADCEGTTVAMYNGRWNDVPSNWDFICEECLCTVLVCQEDSDCDQGYTCEDNECVPPECVQDSDCAEDEECVDFQCTGKGGAEEEEEEGESGEQGNVTPEQPPEVKPPLIVPVEIGEEVIPLVSPEDGAKPPEAGGIWQTVTTAAAFLIAMLILGALIYFLAAKKKKKKVKKEEE